MIHRMLVASVLFLLGCHSHGGQAENGVVNCFRYENAGFSYDSFTVEANELYGEVHIRDVVFRLIQSDIEARKAVLAYELPDDLQGQAHKIKLEEVSSLPYVRQAKCLMQLHKAGDTIRAFKKRGDLAVESGYTLMRKGRPVAFLLTEAKYE